MLIVTSRGDLVLVHEYCRVHAACVTLVDLDRADRVAKVPDFESSVFRGREYDFLTHVHGHVGQVVVVLQRAHDLARLDVVHIRGAIPRGGGELLAVWEPLGGDARVRVAFVATYGRANYRWFRVVEVVGRRGRGRG